MPVAGFRAGYSGRSAKVLIFKEMLETNRSILAICFRERIDNQAVDCPAQSLAREPQGTLGAGALIRSRLSSRPAEGGTKPWDGGREEAVRHMGGVVSPGAAGYIRGGAPDRQGLGWADQGQR